MKLTLSSIARRSAAFASSRFGGSPQIPLPVIRIAPKPRRFTVRSPPMLIVPAADASGCPLIDSPLLSPSDPHGGREIIIDDQNDLAVGVAALDIAVRLGGVVPVVPRLNGDRLRPVVESRRHPDQAAATRLSVVLLPADALRAGKLGMHGRRDQRPVPGRPRRALQGGRGACQYPVRAAVGHLANLVGPVRVGVVDDRGRAEVVHELVMPRTGGGHHYRAEYPGDLHGEVAEPARTRGGQHPLPPPPPPHPREA